MKYKLFIILLFFPFLVFSQKELKEANMHYENFEYSIAIPLYKTALYKDTTLQAVERLADCYRKTNQYKEALKWYQIAINIPYYSASTVYYLAEMLKSNGYYNEAIAQYEFYELYAPEKKPLIEKNINSCEYAKNIQVATNVTVENVKELNTKFSESGITFYNDQLIFSSDRKIGSNTLIDPWTNNSFYKIYASAFTNSKGKISIQKAKLLENNQINKTYHNAFPTFDYINKYIYFTRINFEKNPVKTYGIKSKSFSNRMEIYKSKNTSGKRWTAPIQLNINNVLNYSVMHPSISPDSKYIVFASDQNGGYGGYDLYISEILENDSLSVPKNLGPTINTEGNELFPTFNSFGDLYFSSDGHIGMGGLDLYKSEYKNEVFINITHLLPPFNSPQDDYSILFLDDRKHGYLCSDRLGGKGADDIYYFKYQP